MRAGMRVSFGFRQSVGRQVHAGSLRVGWVRTGRTRRSRWFISRAASWAAGDALRCVDKLLRRERLACAYGDKVIIDGRTIHAHLLLGGGLGLGVPVVSYAPRPMIISVWEEVLVIIVEDVKDCATGGSAYNVPRGLYGGMQVAQGLTHLEQGQRSTGVGQTDSLRGTKRLRAIARKGGVWQSGAAGLGVRAGWVRRWRLECDAK